MSKVLITGFEPYGGVKVNPSSLIIDGLDESAAGDVVTAVLPTSYRRAEAEIVDLIHTYQPMAVLMLGLKRRATRLCFERVARNMDDALMPDNDGVIRLGERIVPEAPDNYPHSLPLDRMCDSAADTGESIDLSDDAGGYVCNHVFFAAAHLIASEYPDCRYGFVHVPPLRGSRERLSRMTELVQSWVGLFQT